MANGSQVIDITQTLMFAEGNVVKYVTRAGNKAGESTLDDLHKARYYLSLAIEIAEKGAKGQGRSTARGLCPPSDLDGFTTTG